jgi:hypothetical protein
MLAQSLGEGRGGRRLADAAFLISDTDNRHSWNSRTIIEELRNCVNKYFPQVIFAFGVRSQPFSKNDKNPT